MHTECANQTVTTTLDEVVQNVTNNALKIGHFVNLLQNETVIAISTAENETFANDTLPSSITNLNATGVTWNTTSSVVVTTLAPTSIPSESPSRRLSENPSSSPSLRPSQNPSVAAPKSTKSPSTY